MFLTPKILSNVTIYRISLSHYILRKLAFIIVCVCVNIYFYFLNRRNMFRLIDAYGHVVR